MTTRALVGMPVSDGTTITGYRQGRYVHVDGYPQRLGLDLVTLLEREGSVAAVTETLLASDWSAIQPATTAEDHHHNPQAATTRPGWGFSFTGIFPPRDGSLTTAAGLCRWLYLFDPDTEEVAVFYGVHRYAMVGRGHATRPLEWLGDYVIEIEEGKYAPR